MDSMRCEERRINPSDYKSFALERTESINNNDIEGSLSTTVTLEVMNICKIKVIRPFNIMLTMVGWRSLITHFQSRDRCSLLIRVADKVVLILFISLLLFSYVYEALSCRYEKNIMEKIVPIGPLITTLSPLHNFSTIGYFQPRSSAIPKNVSENNGTYIMCSHISTTYIIPNIIHFVAYILGMIHYRINDNEDIYGLMEKTLQYSAALGTKRNNYSVVTNMLKLWTFMAGFWVLLAIVSYILYGITFNTFTSPFYTFITKSEDSIYMRNVKHLLFTLDFFGYIIASVVTVTIVLNYTIYCELIKFYVDAISKKIEMRCIKVNMIKNDIQNVDGALSLINGMIGKMMTLIFILELNLIIVGVINLLSSNNSNNLEVAYRFYFVIHLIPLILTALIQCVRVNLAMKTFKRWGLHMTVFGYRKESKKQLDSFLLFTMGHNSKVRLMAYPMEWWQVLVFFIMLSFIVITLIQTGVMDQAPVFKYL